MEEKRKILFLKISIAVVYFLLVIGVEFSYRSALFDMSLTIEEDIQKNISNAGWEYFKFITHFGELKVTFAFIALAFLFLPLTKSFMLVSLFLYGYYFTNLMKMMYSSPRPFWFNLRIYRSCNTGFGNPSGHSFTTFSLYPVLFHLTTDFEFFKKQKPGIAIRVGILILYLLLMLSIVSSRIVLGAHSINQVLYGSLLGLGLYYVVYHIMEYQEMTNKEFYDHLFNKRYVIVYGVVYTMLFFFNLFFYLFGQVEVRDYLFILHLLCPDKKEYQLLYPDGFIQSLGITGLIGAHGGLMLLYYLSVRKFSLHKAIYINQWNSNGTFAMFFIRLPIIVLSAAFFLLNLIKSDHLWVLFVFKAALAYGLGLFGLFGIGIYVCAILMKCNQDIYANNTNLAPEVDKGEGEVAEA